MARGSIVKRIGKRKVAGKPAVYYYAVYYVGKKQKWEKAPYPGRKEDADRLLRQRLREIDQGEYREVRKTTFAEFAAGWIRDYVEDPNHCKRSTASTYRGIFERRLLPFFGEYPLTAITAEKVQEFTSGLSREGLSAKTVRNQLVPMGSILNAAVRLGYLKTSPMGMVKKPKVRRREMAFLAPLEVQRLLEVTCEDWRAFFTTAVLTGMRLGELVAMRWASLNWKAGTYHVRERLYEGHFDTPKSEAGQRAVDLSPGALEALKAHRAAQTAHRLEFSPIYLDEDLVFCTDRGTPLVNLKKLRKAFADALKAAGCPKIRIHDLRHTYAALVIAQNASPKYIQRQLGHASIQVTFDTYGHLMPEAGREVVEKLDLQVFGAAH